MMKRYRLKQLVMVTIGIMMVFFSEVRAHSESPLLSNEVGKIYIDEDGIYRIGYLNLLDAGIDPAQIDPSTFQLMNQGEEIPLYLGDTPKIKFEPNDYIEFYGKRNYDSNQEQNEYSNTNIYYLTWEKCTGLRWKIEPNEITTAEKKSLLNLPMFKESLLRKETFTYSRTAAVSEDKQNLWYWRELAAPIKNNAFSFIITHLVSDSTLFCSLVVDFQGVSHAGTHYAVIGLNGNQVGEARWNGQTRYVYKNDIIPIELLKEGKNILQISLPGKAGDPTGKASDIDVIYMIQFKLDYWKTYTATNNELAFRPPTYQVQSTNFSLLNTPEEVSYEINGFTNSEIKIFDIKHTTVILPKITLQKSVKKYTAEFTVLNEDSATDYIALVDSRKKEPVRIEKINYQDLSQDTSGAEYLVITHDEFYDAIQPLAEWRESTGLTSKVVKISQIYDSFSYGLIDPKAIRAFIAYTYKNWKPVPRYVLLVGDASIDLQGNLNQANARLFIPTYYWRTYMGAAASDNWYVAVGSDETRPEMAIGRISAHSVEEVNNVVNKILQYEQTPIYGRWRQQMLFLASPESMFEGISEELAKSYVPSYYEVYRRYPSSGSPDYKYRTDDIIGNINDGRIILHFTGHGGGYVWESGRMDLEQHGVEVVPDNRDYFGSKNINQLQNRLKYPLVIALTCYTGVFDNLKDDSLGEILLKVPNAGAIAVISATWRSYVSSNDAFDRAMFRQMFQRNTRRIGDVFLNAKKEINIPETSATYILLGDPALLLSFPQDTVQLHVIRTVDDRIKIDGTLVKKYKAKGTIIVKTEKGKTVLEKNISFLKRNTFTQKIKIPKTYAQDSLVIYCYIWDKKTGWDALGYASVPRVTSNFTIQNKNIAMPQYLSTLLWGITSPKKAINIASNSTAESTEIATEAKAQYLFDAGEKYYRRKDFLNAFLKYSESFQIGNRNPKLIQKLKQMVVPLETFEKVTTTQLQLFKTSNPSKIIFHQLSHQKAHTGKTSELLQLEYPQAGWYEYWSKDVDIPLNGPLGLRLYVSSTTADTKLELMALVSIGATHRVVFCSQLTNISSQWIELKIDDLYQVAKKRALSQDNNVGDIKVYPELLVSYLNMDSNPEWDLKDIRIIKIGINTRGQPVQAYIDDIELYFPKKKLLYY